MRLTLRQAEILRLVAAGKTMDQVGRKLHIIPATVSGHIRDARKALGYETTWQMMYELGRRGWR